MGVADTAEQLVASQAQNQKLDKETLQIHMHHSLKICIYQPAIDQAARISASESSLDPRACRRNLWTLLLQWLPAHPSTREKSKSKLLDNYVRVEA